jgi:hypothetical protein
VHVSQETGTGLLAIGEGNGKQSAPETETETEPGNNQRRRRKRETISANKQEAATEEQTAQRRTHLPLAEMDRKADRRGEEEEAHRNWIDRCLREKEAKEGSEGDGAAEGKGKRNENFRACVLE